MYKRGSKTAIKYKTTKINDVELVRRCDIDFLRVRELLEVVDNKIQKLANPKLRKLRINLHDSDDIILGEDGSYWIPLNKAFEFLVAFGVTELDKDFFKVSKKPSPPPEINYRYFDHAEPTVAVDDESWSSRSRYKLSPPPSQYSKKHNQTNYIDLKDAYTEMPKNEIVDLLEDEDTHISDHDTNHMIGTPDNDNYKIDSENIFSGEYLPTYDRSKNLNFDKEALRIGCESDAISPKGANPTPPFRVAISPKDANPTPQFSDESDALTLELHGQIIDEEHHDLIPKLVKSTSEADDSTTSCSSSRRHSQSGDLINNKKRKRSCSTDFDNAVPKRRSIGYITAVFAAGALVGAAATVGAALMAAE